ncbi:MAG: hypothetical protein WC650_00735 [Candidatus Doudnabacteria bacterium]
MKIFIISITVIIGLLGVILTYFLLGIPQPANNVEYGINFSAKNMREYNLDPEAALNAILDDLGARKFRLMAYWDDLEKKEGEYDFSDLDWQIAEIDKRNGEIILAFGEKVPRWPECHIPAWAFSLPAEERQKHLLSLIGKIIDRYKNDDHIKIWQVENEPFFFHSFGDCPQRDKKFLEEEIIFVRARDSRPIMLTSSGEFSLWLGEYRRADIFGTSLYKYVYNRFAGYTEYRIPAIFYQRKVALMKFLFGNKPVIVSEQQGEPWIHGGDIKNAAPEIIAKTMSPEKFQGILDYSKQCGFDKVYLWGTEWWYWQKLQGNNTYWQMAKNLFKKYPPDNGD